MTVSVLLEGHLIEGARDGNPLTGKIQADKDVQWIPKIDLTTTWKTPTIGSSLNCGQSYLLQFRQDEPSDEGRWHIQCGLSTCGYRVAPRFGWEIN